VPFIMERGASQQRITRHFPEDTGSPTGKLGPGRLSLPVLHGLWA